MLVLTTLASLVMVTLLLVCLAVFPALPLVFPLVLLVMLVWFMNDNYQ